MSDRIRAARADFAGLTAFVLLAVALLLVPCEKASAAPGDVVTFPLPHSESRPQGITGGPDGNVWFTEAARDAIGRITPEGQITEYPLGTETAPDGITGGPDGNVWFTEQRQIGRITPSGEVTEFPLPGESRTAGGIAAGPDGNLWFTEQHKIGRITPSGQITEFPLTAEHSEAVSITAGPDGNLWFTETNTVPEDWTGARIGRTTPEGQMTEFPLPPGSFDPQGITAGPDGNVWFTNAHREGSWEPQVGHISPEGRIVELPIVDSWEQQIALGAEGGLWVTGFWRHSPVTRINSEGQTTGRYPIPESREFGPSAIAAGPDGNMWVTLPWQDAVVRITPGLPMPINLTPPSIAGAPEPGKTLTALTGSWTENPASYLYQWESCQEIRSIPRTPGRLACQPVNGATGSTYAVTEKDSGKQFRLRVTAVNSGVESDPATSAAVGPVGLHLVPAMSVSAHLAPRRLPRNGQAPATLRIGFTSKALNPPGVPLLSSLTFELGRNIRLHTEGRSSCSIRRLYDVLATVPRRCASAVVGHGRVRSEVKLGEEYVPVTGAMTAYFDEEDERPRLLGRVTTDGVTPITYVLPFRIEQDSGRFGTKLVIPQMHVIHGVVIRGSYSYTFPYGYGRISGFRLMLKGPPGSVGHSGSFVTASCPAPKGHHGAGFPLLRATLGYSAREANALTGAIRQRCEVAKR